MVQKIAYVVMSVHTCGYAADDRNPVAVFMSESDADAYVKKRMASPSKTSGRHFEVDEVDFFPELLPEGDDE